MSEPAKNETENTTRPRLSSLSNRFEVEKVDEKPPPIPPIPPIDDEALDAEKAKQDESNNKPHSSLKKTVKHYQYDDYFDFDSNQNTATGKDKANIYQTQKSSDSEAEKEPLTSKSLIDDDEKPTTCFNINYNENNEPSSITCNLTTGEVDSYKNCVHDFKTVGLYQKLIAEFIGTLILTLYACSIGMPIAEKGVPSINGCLGGGLTLATLVWGLGNVSGGHLNPAVTIAFLFTGKINPILTVMYVIAQLVGALTGASILNSIVPESARGNLSITEVHPDVSLGQAFGIELIITFILVLTIFSCVDSRRSDLGGSFPLQIGFAVVVGGLFGGKFTGGSMNPARSFGPALISGLWHNHWVYWLGPIFGGVLAGLIYQFLLTLKCPRTRVRKSESYMSA